MPGIVTGDAPLETDFQFEGDERLRVDTLAEKGLNPQSPVVNVTMLRDWILSGVATGNQAWQSLYLPAATGGQTIFTVPSGYTPQYIKVYVNGVRQVEGVDFTATNGSTIVFGTGLQNGDVVSYDKITAFNVANVLPLSSVSSLGQLLVAQTTQADMQSVLGIGGSAYLPLSGGVMTGTLEFQAAQPTLKFNETDASSGNRIWDIISSAGSVLFRVANDAYNSFATWLQVTRSGNTVSEVRTIATKVVSQGAHDVTGTLVVGAGSANANVTVSGGGIEVSRSGGAYIDLKDADADDFDVRIQATAASKALVVTADDGTTLSGILTLQGNKVRISNAQPFYELYESDAATDYKITRLVGSAGTFFGQFATDAGAPTTFLQIGRSGATATDIDWTFSGAFRLNGVAPWTSANDGSGSGLDADLLDGLHASDLRWTLIAETAVTGAATAYAWDVTGYNEVQILYIGLSTTSASGALAAQVGTSSALDVGASTYFMVINDVNGLTSNVNVAVNTITTGVLLNGANKGNADTNTGLVRYTGLNQSDVYTRIEVQSLLQGTSELRLTTTFGYFLTKRTDTWVGIRTTGTNTIDAGTFQVIGRK